MSTVNPQPYLDRLTAAVERLTAVRSLSRQLHTLAEEAFTMTNDALAHLACDHGGVAEHPTPG